MAEHACHHKLDCLTMTSEKFAKLTRRIWCIFVKHLAPCDIIQRWLVRRKLAALRKWREEVEKEKAAAQFHSRLMVYASYRAKFYTTQFLRDTPKMWSFVELAAAHYNTQIDHGRDHSPELYIKPDFDSKLDIAQNYFIRDRCGLVEWWTRFTRDGREFLNDNDRIKLDLQIPFHEVFADKCLREFGIEVNPDNIDDRRYLDWPCLDVDGNPNTSLMKLVKLKAMQSSTIF